ncbi:type II toxin-antitoxin system VapB family antitoxin [Mesorhizobium koreense]|jgi:Arc/MetJ family transcription regulator|uniref:type II toxin-antitoxin system VapB family antitoxin n=1 Tax=Mesorhizobium koreense TaxID=3074855 RepID=UPI00287BB9C0|nr:type II toxin-antitoxin system VapB family antitoxin [Mesorhizobium sp. WR6]
MSSWIAALLNAGRFACKPELRALLEPAGLNVYIHGKSYTSDIAMRTNIDIDDRLMKQAMKATGQKTKKAAVEAALRKVIEISDQVAALDDLWGMGWEGDLQEMRNDWTPDVDWGLQDKPGKP